MAEDHVSLASVYKGWDGYQQLLVKAIAPLSPEQLALRAAPHLRSLSEQVAQGELSFLLSMNGLTGIEI